ncbi:hypothetical protein CAPTEDRAFT_150729 [Capitella teleta]|uniref:Uncharacterized protein n=1 Tax=Capitella teleta TaxID=283909 RepID=R7V5C8_CAPTE|nr:hypothetical protein CAPTEDRAFT_150729 [Capitella teleta]|eukprot:ELU13749.1 hypothetical protein CAPTEDRAFT_150729 [Capitella teleta]
MDVRKSEEIAECVHYVQSQLKGKGLWGLVNNAGLNFFGAVETTSMEQYERIADINQLGMVRVTKQFLPLIRKSKGRIMNVTSIKGLVSEPMNAAYCMTKYATEAFSDILRMEMKQFGVSVVIVEPGDYGGATGCLEMERIKGDISAMWDEMTDELRATYGKAYLDAHTACIEKAIPTTAQCIDPVVETMVDALYALQPRTRYLVPGGASWYDVHVLRARLARVLPSFIVDALWMHDLRAWPLPEAVSQDDTLNSHH